MKFTKASKPSTPRSRPTLERHAVILAGGRGTRLRPYTVSLPKPLVPLGDQPILELIIRQLAASGFRRISLAVNHQADIIQAYFGDGHKWGVVIDYSFEPTPLGTMGPLRLLRDLPENFLVMNGDVLTDLDYAAFLDRHVRKGALLSISAARRQQLIDFGVLSVDTSNDLVRFQEKPRLDYLVSMGVYGVNRGILDMIPKGRAFGFDHLVLAMLKKKSSIAVVPHRGYWLDIGRPEDYESATNEFLANGLRFLKHG